MTPLGIRNNNPCNLKDNGDTWVGKTGVDDAGFCIFDTAAHGIRAAALCLRNFQYDHRLYSIAGLIRRWSTTDVESYVKNVCLACGAKPDEPYPLTPVSMTPMIGAMIRQECGENGRQPWFTAQQIRAAVDTAFA